MPGSQGDKVMFDLLRKIAIDEKGFDKMKESQAGKLWVSAVDPYYRTIFKPNSPKKNLRSGIIKVPLSYKKDPDSSWSRFNLGHEMMEKRYRKDAVSKDPITKMITIGKSELPFITHDRRFQGPVRKTLLHEYSGFNHNSPRVILAEHNMLTTASPKLRDKKLMKIRQSSGEQDLIRKVLPGFEHGKSPRLNRRTIKGLWEIMKSRGLA